MITFLIVSAIIIFYMMTVVIMCLIHARNGSRLWRGFWDFMVMTCIFYAPFKLKKYRNE